MKSTEMKYLVNDTNPAVHTGQLLKTFFKARRIHKNALARKLNRHIGTLVTFQKNSSIQTAILWEISHVLKHNFFADIACRLPVEFTTDAPVHTEQSERIVALEEELKLTKAERDVLLKAMGR